MILVTGANGQFGNAVLKHLLNKGATTADLAGMVRSEEKASSLKDLGIAARLGDYTNYKSLVNAFKGIDQLVLVSSSEMNNRSEQHVNAIKAAKEAGVKHIYYTSFERKNETASSPIAFVAESHIAAEEHIMKSGMTYTIFRNNLYADMLPMFLGEKVLESGAFFPAGDGAVAFAFRDDMAEAMANVLLSEGHENKVYSISYTERVSFAQIADFISQASGKNVPYLKPAVEVYQGALKQAGVPEHFVAMFAGFGEAMNQGEFDTANSDLPHLLKRTPKSVKSFITEVYGKN